MLPLPEFMKSIQIKLIKPALHRLKLSPFGEVITRGKEIYRVFDRRGQHIILAVYASHTISLLLTSLKLFGLASLLIILGKPQMVMKNHYMQTALEMSGLNQDHFLILISGILVTAIILQQIVNMVLSLLDLRLEHGLTRRASVAVYNYYITLPYETLIKKGPTLAIGKGMMMTGKVVTSEISKNKVLFGVTINGTLILAALFFIIPFAAIATLAFILLFFALFFIRYKAKIRALGQQEYIKSIKRVRLLREGAAGAIELATTGKTDSFVNEVQKVMVGLQKNQIQTQIRTRLPSEFLRATGILILYAVAVFAILSNASHALPTVVMFGAAAFRMQLMMKSLFTVFLSQEKNRYQYKIIIKDLKEARKLLETKLKHPRLPSTPVHVRDAVTFESVSYWYSGTKTPVIDKLNVSFPANKVIVLCGKSGVGKTTLVRLLSGLLVPKKGKILIDGKSLHEDEALKEAWQRSFGITFQKPFFMNSSLAMNIAFEIEKNKIDYERIHEAVKLAQLEELIAELPNGVDTELAEDAEILSGGQKQRVAIARSLYQKTPIFIFDEATSAIDLTTERKIISALTETNEDKLIVIISHRIEIMRFSDMVMFMKKDKSMRQGSVNQLLEEDAEFKIMMDSMTVKAG